MIRQAVASDALKAVPLIMEAIGHIAFVLTGTIDSQEAASILNDFFVQEDNRISYQNALAMEEEGSWLGWLSSMTRVLIKEFRSTAKTSETVETGTATVESMARVYLDRVLKDVSTKPSTKHYRAQIVAAILEILARAFDHET